MRRALARAFLAALSLAAALALAVLCVGRAEADDGLTPVEVQYLYALHANGISWGGTDWGMVNIGLDICTQLIAGRSVDDEAAAVQYGSATNHGTGDELMPSQSRIIVEESVAFLCPFVAGRR